MGDCPERGPAGPGSPLLRTVDLWKCYDGDCGEETPALRGANLVLHTGEVAAILGRSGSGKSTLLSLIAGLDRPTRGLVEVEGRDITALGERDRTFLRRTRIGFVFQFFNLLPTLTAHENVFLSMELAGRPDPLAAETALAEVGLAGKGRRFPHELSGGEQQRVAVARALVKDPVLILADEPTGNLDSHAGEAVLSLLVGRCRTRGAALLVATHSSRVGEAADRILRIEDGVLAEIHGGTADR